jgi:hypothetical protein
MTQAADDLDCLSIGLSPISRRIDVAVAIRPPLAIAGRTPIAATAVCV